MTCEEILKIIKDNKTSGSSDAPDTLLSLLTVLRAFECQGFVPAHTEREKLILQAQGEIEKMRGAGIEPHQDIIKVLNYFSK
jgi:hypothetical protein